MQIGNRLRCYPTQAQQNVLLQWIGCQRFIYNAKVGEDRYYRSFARKSLDHTGQFAPIDQQYSQFKDAELTPWLSEVPSQLLRNGAVKCILGDGVTKKKVKRVGITKQKVGAGCSEPAGETQPTSRGDVGKSSGWQHLGVHVCETRNPCYSASLAAGDFIRKT